MNHTILYSGSEVMVLAVKNILEENQIPFIVRDDIESAIGAGYGALGKAVNILVEEQDLARAQALLKENDIHE